MMHKSPFSIDHSLLTLRGILAPQGIITFTTGGDELGLFLKRAYGTVDPAEVRHQWQRRLAEIKSAKVALIGVPMDAGAGFERGSFKGPLGIRSHLAAYQYADIFKRHGILDVGDVWVNPALIDASMLQADQLEQVRNSRLDVLKKVDPEAYEYLKDKHFAVTPHDQYLEAMFLIQGINPTIRFLGLGGDHSTSRVPVQYLTSGKSYDNKDLGVLHFDAHTDLLERRDGVAYSFATWAHYANERIGRQKRLYQVGVRVSGRSKKDWETSLDLIQRRMDDLGPDPDPVEVAADLKHHFDAAGVRRLFISNDIDATDPHYASATGTVEKDGLKPDFVVGLIAEVAKSFEIVGSDIVEVAPPLNGYIPGEPARTLQTACRYLVAQLSATLQVELPDPFHALPPATPEQVSARPSYSPYFSD